MPREKGRLGDFHSQPALSYQKVPVVEKVA
jgi:hypothetical protein